MIAAEWRCQENRHPQSRCSRYRISLFVETSLLWVGSVSQANLWADRISRLFRALLIMGLSLSSAISTGCATARPAIQSMWQQVPPVVHWSSKKHPPKDSVATDQEAEPAVAANVSLNVDEAISSAAYGSSATTNSPTKSKNTKFGVGRPRSELNVNDETSALDTHVLAVTEDVEAEMEESESPVERLNAALTDDALEAKKLPLRSLTLEEVRVRVDSLLSRARRLLDIGQLDQARRAARLALKLGEDAKLDYSPDEDRPIDVVRRIEGQQEVSHFSESESDNRRTSAVTVISGSKELRHLSSDPVSEADNPIFPIEPKSPKEVSPVRSSNEPDSVGLARKRRDWSTLFRREKKSPVAEPDLSIKDAKNSLTTVSAVAVTRPLAALPSSQAPSDQAMVTANRSFSQEFPEAEVEEVSLTTGEIEEPLIDINPSLVAEMSPLKELPQLKIPNFQDDSLVELKVANADESSKEDKTTVSPEFEMVVAESPFHEVDSSIGPAPYLDVVDSDNSMHQSDWTYIYIAFGICSLLALRCYRHGTT